ncbi:MAG: hypothetical protein AB7O46_02460 [Xanthobacteraceae bacterium]
MHLRLPVILILAAFASLFLIVLIGPGQHPLATPEAVTIKRN